MPVYLYFDLKIGYQAYLEICPDSSVNVLIRDYDGKKYYLEDTIFSKNIVILGFDLDNPLNPSIDYMKDNSRYRVSLYPVLED